MLTPEEIKRYNRHIILSEIGEQGQEKLKAANVLVAGCGGLGCPCLQYLVAAGVGHIGIIDFDLVSESNLQRQILFSTQDIGKSKVLVAKKKLNKQNPFVKIKTYAEKINPENALIILKKYDIIIDCTDNFSTRYLLNDACVILKKPLVSGSVFKFDGQATVFNYQDGPTYRCLYPEPPLPKDMPNCNDIGILGVVPGMIGAMQANETIKIITGIGDVLKGKLFTFNALTMEFNIFSFQKDEENKNIRKLSEFTQVCSIEVKEISADELKQKIQNKEDFQLIDVREEQEHQANNIGGELIPLNSLSQNLDKISADKQVIVYCQLGARSRKAVEFLQQKQFTNIYNLKNGLLDF